MLKRERRIRMLLIIPMPDFFTNVPKNTSSMYTNGYVYIDTGQLNERFLKVVLCVVSRGRAAESSNDPTAGPLMVIPPNG